MPLLLLSICLTFRFRVTVSLNALLSFVGPAHQLLLPPAVFNWMCFEQINLI